MNFFNNEQQLIRPQHLTPNFFSTIMITETKRKAILQITSMAKKRQNVYSTKINDGYFIVKVMMINQAAIQIQKQAIKPFDIIEGWIRNHGQGIVVIKQQVRIWKYDSQIGQPISWRLKKQNINYKGFNIIQWQSQRLNLSQIVTQPLKLQFPLQLIPSETKQNNIKIQQHNKVKSIKSDQIQKLLSSMFEQQDVTTDNNKKQQKLPDNNDQKQKISLLQLQNIDNQQQLDLQKTQTQIKLTNITIDKQISQERFQNILELLLSDEQQEKVEENIHRSQKKQDIQQFIQSYQKVKSQRKRQLQFMFDCLNQDSETHSIQNINIQQQQINVAGEVQNKDIDADVEEDFLQWILKKPKDKPQEENLREINRRQAIQKDNVQQIKQNCQVQQKEKQQKVEIQEKYTKKLDRCSQICNFLDLLDSSDEINNQQQQIKQKSYHQLQYNNLKYLTLQNIYHGFTSKQKNWYTKAVLRCFNYQNQILRCILCDQLYRYPINATFINIGQLNIEFKENALYILGKGRIKETSHPIKINCSYNQLQFNGMQTLVDIQEGQIKDIVEPTENYCLIENIHNLEQGIVLNCFGVLKSFKYYKSKNNKGGSLHYQMADPLTKRTIYFVQFQVQIQSQAAIKELINKPITIYNASIGSYKGIKNILSRTNTIIQYDWLPYTKIGSSIRSWLDWGNHISQIQTQLVGYNQIQSLSQISEQASTYLFIKSAIVISFKNNFIYKACINCLKKIYEMKCIQCGIRKPQHLIDRLFLIGVIADSTAFINVIFSNQLAQELLKNGFASMQQQWLLKTVSIWLQKGTRNSISIIRMKPYIIKAQIESTLNYIKKQIL